jgi:hypothetical protein
MKIKLLFGVCILIFISAINWQLNTADAITNGVYLWSGKNLTGTYKLISSPSYATTSLPVGYTNLTNVEVNSLKIIGDCYVEAFEDTYYNGKKHSFIGTINDLSAYANKIKSIRIVKMEDGVYLIDGKNYSGRVLGFNTNTSRIYSLSDYSFDNKTQSIKLHGNVYASFYEHSRFFGISKSFISSVADLGNLSNKISSFKLDANDAVFLSSEKNFKGEAIRLNSSISNLGVYDIEASSLRISGDFIVTV